MFRRKKVHLLFLALILLVSNMMISPSTVSAAVEISPSNANIQYFGRWDKSASAEYRSYWPGASLRVSFTGSSVSIKLGSTTVDLYAKIDNGGYVPFIDVSGTVQITPTPIGAGTHTVTVVAKDILDVISFQGFVLENGATTVASAPKNNLIEFVGDSITVGYTTTNVAISSYARLTSELLNADNTQIAYTGICLQTGVACYAPNSLGMSEQFFKLKTGDYLGSPNWDFNTYQPTAVVINLGTNDNKFNVSDANFQSTYTTFLANVRAKYPSARLFVLRTLGGFKVAPTQAAVNARIAAGDTKVHYVNTTGWLNAYPSSDYNDSLHPSNSGHVKVANQLAAVMRPYLPGSEPANEIFINSGFESGDSSGWSQWSNIGTSYRLESGGAHSGNWKLAHYNSTSAYKQKTSRAILLPNGNYSLSVWVRSTGGQNALHLYAKNYGSSTELQAVVGSTAYSSWTEFVIPNIPVTNGQVEIGVWSDANANNWAAFDDFVLSRNYANNSSFETGNTSGWSEWNNVGGAQTVEFGGTHSGDWKLTHYSSSAYKQKTYQVQSVPNGTYKLSVWIRSTGGQNALLMYAHNFGSSTDLEAHVGAASVPSWTRYTIDNIPVTNGQIEFGIWSDANANNWAAMDDFILIKK